jgi:hypothetical protein
MNVRLFCNIDTCLVIVEGNGYTFYLSLVEAEEVSKQLEQVLAEAKARPAKTI